MIQTFEPNSILLSINAVYTCVYSKWHASRDKREACLEIFQENSYKSFCNVEAYISKISGEVKFSLYVLRFRESAYFFDRNAERLGHILCWSKILSSLRNTRTPPLSSCLPTPLSLVPPSLISFPALSHLFFISSSSHFLSLSLSLLLYPPCSSPFHQLAPACLLLHKHWTQSTIIVMCCRVISGLADRSPSPRSLFLLLLFSAFSMGRYFSGPIYMSASSDEHSVLSLL